MRSLIKTLVSAPSSHSRLATQSGGATREMSRNLSNRAILAAAAIRALYRTIAVVSVTTTFNNNSVQSTWDGTSTFYPRTAGTAGPQYVTDIVHQKDCVVAQNDVRGILNDMAQKINEGVVVVGPAAIQAARTYYASILAWLLSCKFTRRNFNCVTCPCWRIVALLRRILIRQLFSHLNRSALPVRR